MSFFLGIDLGTSYFKAGVYDSDCRLCGMGRVPVPKTVTGGRCELPIIDFWQAVKGCIAMALADARLSAGDIAAVSYSSQANSFVLLDSEGLALSPLILWPDARARQHCGAVQALSSIPGFMETTGLGIDLNEEFMVAKLAWLRDNEPEIWARTANIMTISDFLVYGLTLSRAGDLDTAAMTGLLDIPRLSWWKKAMEAMGLEEEMFSEPQRSGTLAGYVIPSAAALTGLEVGTPVYLGTLDHYAVAIGAGILEGHRISESTGTVLAAAGYSGAYKPAKGIITSPGLDSDHYFRLAFDGNGATAVEWYQKNYAPDKTILQIEDEARSIPAGCDGLRAKPRSDTYEGLTGFENIRSEHTPAHFLRAIFESTARTLAHLVETLDPEKQAGEIIPSGGGARNTLWLQIKEEMLQRRYLPQASGELATKGAAMLCMAALQNENK